MRSAGLTREGSLHRLWRQRYSRTGVRIGLGCAVMAGVCISQLGGPVTGADTAFVPGTALAGAHALSLAPTTGGLNYAITLATSLADYQQEEAQSLSQTIDLGAIGTSLESEGCNNSPPTIPKKDVPPPIQAESTTGAQSLTATIVPGSTATGIGVGNEAASVTTQPSGTATTTTAGISLPGGLLSVGALTSTSTAAIVNGNTRTATATSDVGEISLAKGAVIIGGLHWAATQSSGATTTSSGTFSVGSIKVAGLPVPVPSLASPQGVLNIINTALNGVGFNIEWPAPSTLPDGTIVISPLIIGIDNNTLGQEVVGANLGTVQPLRSALVGAILKADCNLAAEITVSDIGVGVLAGGGNLNLSLGGANAVTTDAAAVNPFGSTPALSTSPLPLDTGTSGGLSTSGSLVTPGFSAPTTTPTVAPTGGTGTGVKTALGPTEKTTDCISLGPAGGGCDTGNAAVSIGFIGLGLVVLLAAWDYLRQRRRQQLNGQEVLA